MAADIILLDILYSNIRTIVQCLEKTLPAVPSMLNRMLSSEPQKMQTLNTQKGPYHRCH